MSRVFVLVSSFVLIAALTVMANLGPNLVAEAAAVPKTTDTKSNKSRSPKKAAPTSTSAPAPAATTTAIPTATSTSIPAGIATVLPTLEPAPTATPQASPTPAVVDIPEGSDWTLQGTVLSPKVGAWDDLIWDSSPGCVIKVGSTYYMYYNGADDYDEIEDTPTNRKIGVATSADGVTFTKHARNPVITYSTGAYTEEGASNPVVLFDNGTWHMWYGASRYTSPSLVDVDIRYRTSTDGFTWTSDTLVYQVSGHEYIPIGAFKSGSTYHLYYLGDLARGAGPLRVMSGTNPASLSGTTQLAAGPFRGSSGLDELDSGTLAIHLMGETFGNVQAYTIEKSAPRSISSQLRNYTFTGYARHAVFLDGTIWRMYQLDGSGEGDGTVVLRTTGPMLMAE